MMGQDWNYYAKVGRKYVPVGCSTPNLYNGIWMIYRDAHAGHNLVCRMSGLPEPIEVQELAKSHMMCDAISKVWMEKREELYYKSAGEVADIIANEVYLKLVGGE